MGTTPTASYTSHACTKQAGFWWKVSSLLLESIVQCSAVTNFFALSAIAPQTHQVTIHAKLYRHCLKFVYLFLCTVPHFKRFFAPHFLQFYLNDQGGTQGIC